MGTTRRPLDGDDLCRRHAEGQSVLQMARELGVGRNVVSRQLDMLGLPRRSASEANRIRMQRMTPAERRVNTHAANEARRVEIPHGYRASRQLSAPDSAVVKAATFQDGLVVARPDENRLAHLAPHFQRQVAVGPYNLDFRIGSVAVEVHSARTNPARFPELARRAVDLLDAGWSVGYLWRDGQRGCEDLIAWAEFTSRDVPGGGEYRMVRGDGEVMAVTRAQLDERAHVLPPRRRQYLLPSPGDLG